MKILKMLMIMVVIMMGDALGDIVDGTCKQTSDYTFCVSLLRSDSRSSSADTAGLAVILVDQIKVLGMKVLDEIPKVYQTKPLVRGPLVECIFGYKIIVREFVEEAYRALPKNPKSAENGVIGCKSKASKCEDGFPKGQSPLTNLNTKLEKIADVATTIFRLLL